MFLPSFLCGVVLYFVSFILVFFSSEWFIVWVGLELNMFSYLVLCVERESGVSLLCFFKYYYIQVLASGVLLVSVMGSVNNLMLLVALSLSMGLGPFYYWFVSLVDRLNWFSSMILMTMQSIIPFYLLSTIGGHLLLFFGIFSVVVGVFSPLSLVSLKGILGYSSVNHMGWMIILQMIGSIEGWLYLGLYVLMVFFGVLVFMEKGVCGLSEGINTSSTSFMLIMFSFGGVPPLLGFFLKLYGLMVLVSFDLFFSWFFVLSSIVMLYIYVRIVWGVLMAVKCLFSHEDKYNSFGFNLSMLVHLAGGLFMMLVFLSL